MRFLNFLLTALFNFLKGVESEQEPDREDAPVERYVLEYDMPKIVAVDSPVQTHGKYLTKSGMPRGLVVHFTAGRSLKGAQDAINTMHSMASRGLGCLVMDKDGVIYKAKSQGWNDVAYHAGASEWRGRSAVSLQCMGMEICCAGNLDREGNAWFKEKYPANLVRTVLETKDNHLRGFYHKFTEAQEKALIDFIMWQIDTNPEFDISWVVGHDECAVPAGRKPDPGGSMSLTMPELRNFLREEVKKRSNI
jgi:N-acetyl-anhydromuramyl-L-alanine amidase AmpD